MKKYIKKLLCKLIREEEAATAVEYAVMLMLIIGVCLTAIQLVGSNSSAVWNNNSDELNQAMDAALNSGN